MAKVKQIEWRINKLMGTIYYGYLNNVRLCQINSYGLNGFEFISHVKNPMGMDSQFYTVSIPCKTLDEAKAFCQQQLEAFVNEITE